MKSIKEERMMVLNLVQEGKITVDEATKLLDALNTNNEESYQEAWEMEDKINKFSKSVDQFAKEVGEKMSSALKDVEPKVKNATKTVIEKAVVVLDDISESLNESLKNLNENGEECEEGCCCCNESGEDFSVEVDENDVPREN